MENYNIQRPSEGFDWLYKDIDNDNRIFAYEIRLPNGTPSWAECTTAEKEAWEAAHPQPEEPINE